MRIFWLLLLQLAVLFSHFTTAAEAAGAKYVEEWKSLQVLTPIYRPTVEQACKDAYNTGPDWAYYKGEHFQRHIAQSGTDEPDVFRTCISESPDPEPPPLEASWPAYMVCRIFEENGALRSERTGRCPSITPPGCGGGAGATGEAATIDNPVELPTLTKTEYAVDWASSLEPRFVLGRYYRSDTAIVRRFSQGDPAYRQDPLSTHWALAFTDEFYTGIHKNPDDPDDSASYMRFVSASGKTIFFKRATGLAPLNPEYGYVAAVEGSYFNGTSKPFTVTDPQGVVYRFTYRGGAPSGQHRGANRHYLSSVTWRDGFKISFERSFMAEGTRITSISDNRGQRITFTYSTDTLDNGGLLPSEWQRVVGATIYGPGATGSQTLIGHVAYDYADLPETTPRRPVLTAARFSATAGGTVLNEARYQYDLSQFPPLLTGISDGSLSAAGEPVWKRQYTYARYAKQTGNRTVGVGIATSARPGGVMARTYGVVADGSGVTATNPRGLETTYDFALTSGRTRLTAVDGEGTASCLPTNSTISYASTGLRNGIVERNGALTAMQYDASGRLTNRTEDSAGTTPRATVVTWAGTSRFPATIETGLLRTTFTYDASYRLTQLKQTDIRAGSPSLNSERIWTYSYTTLAGGYSVLSSIDGPGLTSEGVNDVTQFTYTADGRLLSVTDPNGNVTQVLDWNAAGIPTLIEAPDKTRSHMTYDAFGRLTGFGQAKVGAAPQMTALTYTRANQIATFRDTRNNLWQFSYDDADLLTEITEPNGDKITYQHDVAGDVTRTEFVDVTGTRFSEQTVFDELGRIRETLGALGQQTQFSFDVEDNLITRTDPAGLPTSLSYDALNRVVSTTDRGGFVTGMAHDADDQITEYTDPRLIETTFTYNGFGEVVTEVSADRGTIQYAYDRRGLVTSRTDGRGITTLYGYDHGGRLTGIDYPPGDIPDITFTHDQPMLGIPADSNRGHVARIDDGIIRLDFGHELLLTGPRVTVAGLYPQGRSYTVVEDRDFEGNTVRTAYPSGREVLVDHDSNNRPSRIRLVDGATTTTLLDQITWAPSGPMTSALYGDGLGQSRSYDQSYRLTGLTDGNGTVQLRALSYGYEARDNLTTITDTLVPGNSESFGYTAREHLGTASGPYGDLEFSYDGVGNRTARVADGQSDGYIYPLSSNRLQQINLATGGSRGFTYDGAGNVIADTRAGQTYGYTYNAAGRMSEFKINGTLQASYTYDAMGRQAIRSLASGQVIHSVFDSMGRRIEEYSETPGALLREYVWLGWEPVAVIESGVIHYTRTDHIGRPVLATDGTGAVVWTASYDPFGTVQASTGTPTTIRFPGQWFQAESGLHQNWMRDYDPTTGRYIQADPLGLVDGASVYGYAGQNPGRWTDPRGEEAVTVGGSFGAWGVVEGSKRIGAACVAAGSAAASGLAAVIVMMSATPAGGVGDTLDQCDACSSSPPPEDPCGDNYKACMNTSLSAFDGSVFGESRCQSCYNQCRGSGVWPKSIRSVRNGALTCRFQR